MRPQILSEALKASAIFAASVDNIKMLLLSLYIIFL